ncbi:MULTISPECIES: hypothetical protein [unclassified Microcoleus]|uniref:hypothetical protein n=2 Tax=Microcoleus TaxID=44471 RepID=UPI002FD6B5FE
MSTIALPKQSPAAARSGSDRPKNTRRSPMLLKFVADSSPNTITLDLRKPEFLNISGINILSKFAIEVRQQKNIQITLKGSKQIPWREKFLKKLQQPIPSLHLQLE